MSKSFYTFFLTHLKQTYDDTGIKSWVDLYNTPVVPRSYYSDFHSLLSLQFSSTNNSGYLNMYAWEGRTTLDFSSVLDFSSNADFSVTSQPINSWEFQSATPLFNRKSRESFRYTYKNRFLSYEYPRNLERLSYSALVTPYIYRAAIPNRSELLDDPYEVETYKFFTPEEVRRLQGEGVNIVVDAPSIANVLLKETEADPFDAYIFRKPDLATYDALAQHTFTGSSGVANQMKTVLEGYWCYINETVYPADFDYCSVSETPVADFENVPHSNVYIDWDNGGTQYSCTYRPVEGRGYLPASHLGFKMEGSTLKEIALLLIYLVYRDKSQLVRLVLDELTHVWEELGNVEEVSPGTYQINSGNIPGLPSYIPRSYLPLYREQSPEYESSRDTLENAWLGLGITIAVKYLRDRPRPVDLPLKLPLLLEQLAQFISDAVQEGTGLVQERYDDTGQGVGIHSFDSTVISNLFLSHYISLNYKLSYHYFSVLTYNAIYSVSGPDLGDSASSGYVMLWRYAYSLPVQLLDEDKEDEFRFLLSKVVNYWVTNSTPPADYCTLVDTGVYSYDGLALAYLQPSLVASTFCLLDKGDLLKPTFNLHAEEAEAFVTHSYQTAKRMWPFGYRWTSQASELAYGTVLGALLFTNSRLVYSWFLSYSLQEEGLSIHRAQAWALNEKGREYRVERERFQSDDYFRKKLRVFSVRNRCTLGSFEDLLVYLDIPKEMLEVKEDSLISFTNSIGQQLIKPFNKLTPDEVLFLSLTYLDSNWSTKAGNLFITAPNSLTADDIELLDDNAAAGVHTHYTLFNLLNSERLAEACLYISEV